MVPPSIQRIDKFDVLRRIGRGGMGSVYLARDPDIDRLVAIKLLNEGFDEDDLRGRFTTEARSASALRHVNIVTIFQTGTFLDRPFIVMEYVEGETFGDIIASGRPITTSAKLDLLDQMLAGLQHAHARGIVHRDIKPSNVMVDAEGVVRILDFGIARLGQGGGTRSGVLLGTINYISPEQLAGGAIDRRTDIFSAGLVAYELLTSKTAFPQAFPEILRQISSEEPPPIDQLCPGIDPDLVGIITRCHAKRPDDRYPDCAAVRRDLDAVRRAIRTPDDATLSLVRPALSSSAEAPPEVAPTIVIPRRREAKADPADSRPHAATPSRRRAYAFSLVSIGVLLIAAGVWLVTSMRQPVAPSPAVVEPAVPAAPVATPAPVVPERQTPVSEPVDAQRSSVASRPEARADASRDAALAARRRAVSANGRGTQEYAVGDVRVGDGDRFAKLGQFDEAVRAFDDAVRRFEEAVKRAPPPMPVRVGGTVKAPTLIKRVSPEYPIEALNARQQGAVILETTIGTTGKVTDVRVVRSIPLLDTAAVDAVRQWEYAATVIDEVAVPVISTVAVEFKLTAPSPVRVGGTIKAPEQTKRVSPPYPPEAQAAGVQGVVIMEATIGVDGKVTDVRVLRSIPLLDQAAMDAVRQWEYAPTAVNGIAVPVVMTVTVNFTLTPAAPPVAPPTSK
jgi:serine/threonine-protein kinase